MRYRRQALKVSPLLSSHWFSAKKHHANRHTSLLPSVTQFIMTPLILRCHSSSQILRLRIPRFGFLQRIRLSDAHPTFVLSLTAGLTNKAFFTPHYCCEGALIAGGRPKWSSKKRAFPYRSQPSKSSQTQLCQRSNSASSLITGHNPFAVIFWFDDNGPTHISKHSQGAEDRSDGMRAVSACSAHQYDVIVVEFHAPTRDLHLLKQTTFG